MATTLYQVDAFTDKPFAGNPAAVAVLPNPADPLWMQAVAAEMNLAETAFLWPEPPGYRLRWFTPTVEVDLCGHATLATAHVLWETGALPRDTPARFITRSGELAAARNGDWIELDFPCGPPEPIKPPEVLDEALEVNWLAVGRNQIGDVIVEIDSPETLRTLEPNIRALQTIEARGVIVTSVSDDPRYDFMSRFFAPRAGIDEDPVCGSAHCCLAPYWGAKLGKETLTAYQASSRGGVLKLKLNGERVAISGNAVTVATLKLHSDAPEYLMA